MKTQQHFISVKSDGYKRRTYSLTLFEVKGRGNIQLIGDLIANYGAHKGETSEAYTKLRELKAIKPSILKAIKNAQSMRDTVSGNYERYYHYDFEEKFGLKIELL